MNQQPDQLAPADGIKMIRHSLRAFAFSFPGLIPLIGIIFIVISQRNRRKALKFAQGHWNPAARQLFWSRNICLLADLVNIIAVIITIVFIITLCTSDFH